MKIKVNENKVNIVEYDIVNKGEYKIHKCYFDFSNEYQGLTKKAIFVDVINYIKIEVPIIEDQCDIPYEILNGEDIELRVYAYSIENDELVLRYSPDFAEFRFYRGSYIEGVESGEEITPSQFDIYTDALNKGLNKIDKTLETVEKNESKRIENEIIRDKKVDDAVSNIQDMIDSYNENAIQKTQAYNDNADQKIKSYDDNADIKEKTFNDNYNNKKQSFDNNAIEKTQQLNDIADGIKDMATAVQFATFEIDDDMNLIINHADRLSNTNFTFSNETGVLEVEIYD